jgi:hypothetical protein
VRADLFGHAIRSLRAVQCYGTRAIKAKAKHVTHGWPILPHQRRGIAWCRFGARYSSHRQKLSIKSGEAMPEFMMILCDVEGAKSKLPPEEVQAHYARVSAWWDAHEKEGRIVPGVARRLQGTNKAKTVRVGNGKATITDGPFAETKEQMGGFGILSVPDMQAALDLVSTWPGLDETIEIRPVLG